MKGKVHYAIDPNEEGLPAIVDLELAPRNADGLVEFSGTFDIVKPIDIGRGNRRLIYEFSNRGGKTAVATFNYGKGQDLTNPAYAGDGFLMRHGYTVVWSGWQGDLIDRGTNCVAYLPEALEQGKRLRGKVRQEFSPIRTGILSMGVSAGAEGGENVQPYPVIDRSTATLTMRENETDPRVSVPDDRVGAGESRAEGRPGRSHALAKRSLRQGRIQTGLASTSSSTKPRARRSWVSASSACATCCRCCATKPRTRPATPTRWPAGIDKVYGTGQSLSGRVMREYVYEGWNEDDEGPQALRRHAHPHRQRPAAPQHPLRPGRPLPPTARGALVAVRVLSVHLQRGPRPVHRRRWTRLWKRPSTDPLVIHFHTEGDYWIRHVSLTHTDPSDASDVRSSRNRPHVPPHGAAPHGAAGERPDLDRPAHAQQHVGSAPYRRAALVMLDEWATNGTPPPATLPAQNMETER